MARIQKKKPAGQKKKASKPQAEGQLTEQGTDKAASAPVEAGGAAPAEGAKEKKPRRAAPAPRKSTAPAGQSFVLRLVDRYFGNWIQFLREVKIELGKVAWPTRKQTVGSTIIVLAFVFIIALFLGIIDIGLSSLVRLVL
jgi:preprotein translocase subunit SecE